MNDALANILGNEYISKSFHFFIIHGFAQVLPGSGCFFGAQSDVTWLEEIGLRIKKLPGKEKAVDNGNLPWRMEEATANPLPAFNCEARANSLRCFGVW